MRFLRNIERPGEVREIYIQNKVDALLNSRRFPEGLSDGEWKEITAAADRRVTFIRKISHGRSTGPPQAAGNLSADDYKLIGFVGLYDAIPER